MVKPLGTVSHALEIVWNPHWDTNRVSPCNYSIKSYNEREVVGPLCLWNCAMKLCIEGDIYFIPKFHILETGTVKLSIETGLMATVWLPKLWASMIPLIWTYGRLIRIMELGDMAHEIPAAQSVWNQNRLSSKADLEILSSFPRKTMNTKVGGNFVPYNQDTEFAVFGVRAWEI
jgi:hypothetical protein